MQIQQLRESYLAQSRISSHGNAEVTAKVNVEANNAVQNNIQSKQCEGSYLAQDKVNITSIGVMQLALGDRPA